MFSRAKAEKENKEQTRKEKPPNPSFARRPGSSTKENRDITIRLLSYRSIRVEIIFCLFPQHGTAVVGPSAATTQIERGTISPNKHIVRKKKLYTPRLSDNNVTNRHAAERLDQETNRTSSAASLERQMARPDRLLRKIGHVSGSLCQQVRVAHANCAPSSDSDDKSQIAPPNVCVTKLAHHIVHALKTPRDLSVYVGASVLSVTNNASHTEAVENWTYRKPRSNHCPFQKTSVVIAMPPAPFCFSRHKRR